MSTVLMFPAWFSGYGVVFEAVFAIISLIIALFAFKIYRASDQWYAKVLGISFSLISVSYVLQSVFTVGTYLHMLFFLLGLVILVCMVFKSPKKMMLWLLIALTLIALMFSASIFSTFYLLSAVYLAIIAWHYIDNFLAHKQTTTLLIALAFLFLFFGSFHYFLSVNHALFFVIGRFLELVAYLLILANIYLVLKK